MSTQTETRTHRATPTETDHHDLTAQGRLDAESVLALRHAVVAVIADRAPIVLVDVSRVSIVTPSGIAGLLELMRVTRSRGGDLRLHGTCRSIDEAHTVLRLRSVTRVYADRAEAVVVGARRR